MIFENKRRHNTGLIELCRKRPCLFDLKSLTYRDKKRYTGWPKKVSHYQIIKKSY